jgi:hypothetical protein
MTMSIPDPTFERHLSVEELAELWGMSQDFVRRLFVDEPGVIIFHHQRPGRRIYRTLRIPESVAVRVHRRMQERVSQPFATRKRGRHENTGRQTDQS